nr:MAG TPA_asm: hypothetical protein [Caudoviricetes sp.]
MSDNMHGFKAYEPGLICRGHKYEENTVYKKSGYGICVPGVTHYCVNPFDVLDHYPLVRPDGQFSDFTTVEAIDPPVTDDDKKFATSTIKIGVKLGLSGFINACVDFLFEKTIKKMPKPEAVDVSNDAQIGSSGDDAQIGSSGKYAQIGSSGDDAKITIENYHGVAAAVGKRGKIKASIGTWCTLAEYGEWDGEGYPCICVKSYQVDGEIIKADVFYTLRNGEIVEAEE